MVLQFKVWRVQWEKRLFKIKGKMKSVLVLVMRDKDGIVRKIAKTKIDQYNLMKWYERYNVGERLEKLLASRKLKANVRRVKERIHRRGFDRMMSLYGIYKDPKTGKEGYRRYEIFKAEKWKPSEVAFLYGFFKTHVPKSPAGIFVFHDGKLFIDSCDTMTKLMHRCRCGRKFMTLQTLRKHIKSTRNKKRHGRVNKKNGRHKPKRTT